jgi:hypothetical protein
VWLQLHQPPQVLVARGCRLLHLHNQIQRTHVSASAHPKYQLCVQREWYSFQAATASSWHPGRCLQLGGMLQ